jgi:VanZ family protein
MTNFRQKVKHLSPALFMMALIFFFSHQPGDSLHFPSGLQIDKILHALIYFLLGRAYIYAFVGQQKRAANLLFDSLIIGLCILYGISDEWHQSFVPMRYPSLADVIADGFGGLAAVFSWRQWR